MQNRKRLCNAGKLKVCSKLVFMMQQFPPLFFFFLSTFCSLRHQGPSLFLQLCMRQQRIQDNAANLQTASLLCTLRPPHATLGARRQHTAGSPLLFAGSRPQPCCVRADCRLPGRGHRFFHPTSNKNNSLCVLHVAIVKKSPSAKGKCCFGTRCCWCSVGTTQAARPLCREAQHAEDW